MRLLTIRILILTLAIVMAGLASGQSIVGGWDWTNDIGGYGSFGSSGTWAFTASGAYYQTGSTQIAPSGTYSLSVATSTLTTTDVNGTTTWDFAWLNNNKFILSNNIETFLVCTTDNSVWQPGKSLGAGSSPGSSSVGEPVNVATGNVFDENVDYTTAGRNKLEFDRYYNSQSTGSPFTSALGPNWTTNYDRYLQIVSGTSILAYRQDGQILQITVAGTGFVLDADVNIVVAGKPSGYTLTTIDGTLETYTTISATPRS
jgi:hypothetical protein